MAKELKGKRRKKINKRSESLNEKAHLAI